MQDKIIICLLIVNIMKTVAKLIGAVTSQNCIQEDS